MPILTKRSSIPIAVIALGVLIIILSVFLVYLNQTNQYNGQGNVPNQDEQISGVQRVSLEQAKAAFDAQQAVFLDVRDLISYQEHHIPEAVTIPLTELETRTGELDPSGWIITYCT